MLEGLDANTAGRFSISFMIIKIHKNATENSTGRKIGVSVGIDVKKSTNPSGNLSLRLPLLSFTYHLFENIKACLCAAVASSHSQ